MQTNPQKNQQVYLDFNATSSLDSGLVEAIPGALKYWGNASSIHWAGQNSKTVLREARQNLAMALSISPLEIVFTSGGSESNTTVIKGVFDELKNSSRNEYITTQVEHPSIIKTFQSLEALGAKVHYLKVSRSGELDMAQLNSLLSEKTALVSVMAANNETGVIFPVKEISRLAKAVGAKMHSDCVQAFGKIPLNLKDLDVDFASISGHKFYSLKGTGLLYCKKGNTLPSLILGGGQERHRRGGTENILGIFAMGFMAKKIDQVAIQQERLSNLRDKFESRVLAEISQVSVNHAKALRLPNTSSLIVKDVDGESLLMSLDVQGYAVSTGAACSSGNPEPSPVLLAIGLTRDEAQNSLRVSFGWCTTEAEVSAFIEVMKEVVTRLRKIKKEAEAV